ncbi:MAG: hypothetical protein EU536_03100 [Promethearchaeota archaeon]|nr:MAG: hypothetical protein EU536_03100 [Candidatus Lokiarchaeota archaeon]
MKTPSYAVLPGEAEKMELLAQEFNNQVITAQMNTIDILRSENEIQKKLDLNTFFKSGFHLYKKEGNLYYRAYLEENGSLFYGIMGGIALAGVIFGLILFPIGFVVIAGAILWYFIGGSIIYGPWDEATKIMQIKLQNAVETAVQRVRSQSVVLGEKPKMGFEQIRKKWEEAKVALQEQNTAEYFNRMYVAVENATRLCYYMIYGRQPESVKTGLAALVQAKVINERVADCNWVWDVRNEFVHQANSSPEDIVRVQRIGQKIVEGCLKRVAENLKNL